MIVVTANNVYIYDGNSPSSVTWMGFTRLSANLMRANQVTGVGSVKFINGIMYFGSTNIWSVAVDFINDKGWKHESTGKHDYLGNISQRNDGLGFNANGYGDGILTWNVNDIAVTSNGNMGNIVAVATDSGASVIHPDGVVVDVVPVFITHQPMNQIAFADGRMWLCNIGGTIGVFDNIPTSDVGGSNTLQELADRAWHFASYPYAVHVGSAKLSILPNREIAYGCNSRLVRILDSDGTSGFVGINAMSCEVFNSSISGWMKGSIRGAWLANSVITDRSQRGNTLTQEGTLTGNKLVATGAELWAYGGFGVNDYLHLPNTNTDLDFTDDFYISFWFEPSEVNTFSRVLWRGPTLDVASNPRFDVYASVNGMVFYVVDSTNPRAEVIAPIQDGWQHYVCQRKDGYISIYRNGDPIETGTQITGDLSGAYDLWLGVYPDTATTVSGGLQGWLSLLRIGEGVMSEVQIEHMYKTEKPLFKENAKCLLQGSGNIGTDTSYSEDDNILAVATTDHITRFNDLTVVSDEATTVTSIDRSCGNKELKGE